VAFGAGSNPPAFARSFGIRENIQVCYSNATTVTIVTTNLTPTLRSVREANVTPRLGWENQAFRQPRILTPIESSGASLRIVLVLLSGGTGLTSDLRSLKSAYESVVIFTERHISKILRAVKNSGFAWTFCCCPQGEQ
jgi:hypothetical protein